MWRGYTNENPVGLCLLLVKQKKKRPTSWRSLAYFFCSLKLLCLSYLHKRELPVPVLRLTSQLPLSTHAEQHRKFSGDGNSKIIFAMAAEAAALAHTRPIADVVGHILSFSLFILFAKLSWPGDSEVTLRSSSQAATCLPLKDGGIPLNALPNGTIKLASLFFTLSL